MDSISFWFTALEESRFASLFQLTDDELTIRNAIRMIADEKPGYPCRVSLADAEVGDVVILLQYIHHEVTHLIELQGRSSLDLVRSKRIQMWMKSLGCSEIAYYLSGDMTTMGWWSQRKPAMVQSWRRQLEAVFPPILSNIYTYTMLVLAALTVQFSEYDLELQSKVSV